MPKLQTDTVSIADRLRPVLLQVGRELRREAREVGVSPEQVSLLVAIKYAPGVGVRELAAEERVSPPRCRTTSTGSSATASSPARRATTTAGASA